MNAGRGGGGEAGPSRRTATPGEPRKPKKKKAKETSRPQTSGPIPAPYLAIAPSPVSSLSRNALNDLIQPTPSHLVLPSTFVRARSANNIQDAPVPAPSPPTSRRGYAANLAAPPLIMPGGTSATPRIQELTNPPMRRRGDGRRRSEEGLRGLAQANQSMASLGVLGRIMESDPVQGTTEAAPAQRRRRRVIRTDARVSQPPVSTAEEGRAIGLARGASMRRLSVWDGLPDAGEAPPPFIVPPSPAAPAGNPTSPTLSIDHDPPPPFEARGRSPPPTWEQAVSQVPLGPPVPSAAEESIIPAPVETPSRAASVRSTASSATNYASAHESPANSSGEEGTEEEEREDRRLWNADISAGYSLAQRVERESARKKGRELKGRKEVREAEPAIAEEESEPRQGLGLEDLPARPADLIEAAREPEPDLPSGLGGGSGDLSAAPNLILNSPTPSNPESSIPAPPISSDQAITSTPTPIQPQADSPSEVSATPAALSPLPQSPLVPNPSPAASTVAPASHTSPPAPVPKSKVKRAKSKRTASPPPPPSASGPPKDEAPSGPSVPTLAPLAIPVTESAPGPAKPKVSTRTKKRSTRAKVGTPAPAASSAVAEPQPTPVETLPSATSSVQVEASLSPLSPAQQSQADTYWALTGTSDPSSPQSPATIPSPASPPVPLARAGSLRSLRAAASPKPVLAALIDSPAESSPSPKPPTPIDAVTAVKDRRDNSASPAESDVILAPIPQRKLTRGKAIRRSSSGLMGLSDATLRSPPSGPESPRRPLFGETQFDWRPAERQDGEQKGGSSSIRPSHHRSASSIAILRSPPQSSTQTEGFGQSGRALGSFDTAFDSIASPTSPISSPIEGLPPHREAALKRRELITRSPEITTSLPPFSPPLPAVPSQPPLIDISASTPHRHTPYRTPPPLISRDLYQLFDEDEPIAESSSQATARMEQEQIFKAIKRDRREWAVDEILVDDEMEESERAPTPPAKGRRAPPPPPPLRRNLISTTVGANLTPRRSIIRSADTPVTPRPIRQLSVGSQDRPPVLPTRRPAPAPPSKDIEAEEELTLEPPPLPPRPAPIYRPLSERRESTFSQTDTASSLSDRTIPFTHSLSASPRRPKGPRPPPPPPRWARIIMPLHDIKTAVRPTSERTHSDSASMSLAGDVGKNPTRRSTSEQDLRSSSGGSPLEYTDLDVLVSRLEGSGREYEGFSQITAFLGPGKSLAATPEALATLLPGIISVDSRRVTGAGKVKLKLSLLGVRVTKCPICLGQFKKDEQGVLLPECGHVSHEECATRWFREDFRCFVCRVPLLREETGEQGVRGEIGVGDSGGRLEEGVI